MRPKITKRSYDSRLFTVNVGPAMRSEDTIASVESVVADRYGEDLVIDNISFTGAVIQFRASGGSAGDSHTITMRFTTNSSPVQMLESVVDLVIIH